MSDDARDFTLRFIEYARQTGAESCDAAIERDAERWPGGKMTGFIVWTSAAWGEWCKLKGYRRTVSGSNDTVLSEADRAEFEVWLAARPITGPVR